MKKIFVVWFFLMANTAFAQEAPKNNIVRVVSPPGGVTQTFPAPPPGEDFTVVVDLPPSGASKSVAGRRGGFFLRGGIGTGIMFPGSDKLSLSGGLIGEVGHAKSLWALDATFRVGNCEGGLAINSGLAVMRTVAGNFRVGVGGDLLYCSNVSDHTKEVAIERVVGGSFHLGYAQNHLVLGASVGVGARTIPIPGDRETAGVLYGGFSISYLWGN